MPLPARVKRSKAEIRAASQRLEHDLWCWREQCQAGGKKIPKRIVQARAKWAFQKEGFKDFKVISYGFI